MTRNNEKKEYMIYAGLTYIGRAHTKTEALRMATEHNRNRPTEWAKVLEIKE